MMDLVTVLMILDLIGGVIGVYSTIGLIEYARYEIMRNRGQYYDGGIVMDGSKFKGLFELLTKISGH